LLGSYQAAVTNDEFVQQLHQRIKGGDRLGLRKLVPSSVEANARNRYGWTPLMLAGLAGNTAIIDFLLSTGAEVAAVNNFGESALACASLSGVYRAVQTLLNAGAPIDVRPHGVSLLEYAARGGGHLERQRHIELLRGAGAT
jgi:ankyrin repeat protein